MLIDYIVPFLVALSVLIFFHELGHYWVARRNGVRIEVFSLGFGREITGWTDSAGTRWKVSLIPLGGYVKMFGEGVVDDDGEDRVLTPEEQAVSFHHKRLGQRAAIVLAGPVANFILALVLYVIAFWGFGVPSGFLAGIGTVQPDSAAAEAGFERGDTIVSIQGEKVTYFKDLQRVVSASPGKPLTIIIRRDDEERVLNATPRPRKKGDGTTIGLLGVGPDQTQMTYEDKGFIDASVLAVEQTVMISKLIVTSVGRMFTSSEDRENLGGLGRIAEMAGQSSSQGLFSITFITFMAMLSVNLGVLNLFPVPMLDGGHLVFYLAEAIRGRPLSERVQEYGFRMGLTLVLILMLYAHWNDLVHFKVVESVLNLFS